MTTLSTSTGTTGFLPEDYGDLIIRPVQRASVALQSSTLVTTDLDTYHVPLVADDPQSSWVAEGQPIPTSDALLGEVAVRPRKVAGLTKISSEMANDSSPAAANVMGQALARDIARTAVPVKLFEAGF